MYNPKKIEKKWQKAWETSKAYKSKNFSTKPKKYILVEFPYPSGAGLHMGHLRSYVASDVVSRYYRAKGFEVMYPIGWDAFGLPAENYAIKMGVQPEKSTSQNIKNFKKQIQSLGISFDWNREINTTDPKYYKWTQWLFLKFFEAGLAYEAESMINWCPRDKTGLANEEVIDGKCERCGTVVEKKLLRQWYLKITEYAQKLIDGLDTLDWPERVKLEQKNWIGRSEGAEITFKIVSENGDGKATVFTTRPDTLFGVTYLVLAPEHAMVQKLQPAIENWKEVENYIEHSSRKTDIQRSGLEKEKTGVELKGVHAINPANGEEMPVWIADYVLVSYGTGAIMAVPAHDERDLQCAEKYNLKIQKVVTDGDALTNSGEYDGLSFMQAGKKITEKFGKVKIQYKLRDWVFSRQRYWGEPIPLIHCSNCGIVAVPESELPVTLPKVKKYEPTGTGESPLAVIDSWVNVKCPKCAGNAKRETNTMPQWAGSSWYFLRYADPENEKDFASMESLKYWMPVDLYFGGMEHTTLHLLYSRFWNQFLFDQKLVPVSEPYKRRQPHGIILGTDGEKMSKSRGNVVNPDEIVSKYGADTTRMFEMFLGPHDQMISWNDQGTVGVNRFLQKVWYLVSENVKSKKEEMQDSEKVQLEINKLIKKVGDDIEGIKFNTAISAFMEFINNIAGEIITIKTLQDFLIVLSPFAPHIAEELWSLSGGQGSITAQSWPEFDESKTQSSTVQFVIQVNGKFRGNVNLAKGSAQEIVEQASKQMEAIGKLVNNKPVKKIIFVKDRLINFVV
ncbi:MAG: leucine--tRNA ligase [Candidatus Doudnabacteria bacterium]